MCFSFSSSTRNFFSSSLRTSCFVSPYIFTFFPFLSKILSHFLKLLFVFSFYPPLLYHFPLEFFWHFFFFFYSFSTDIQSFFLSFFLSFLISSYPFFLYFPFALFLSLLLFLLFFLSIPLTFLSLLDTTFVLVLFSLWIYWIVVRLRICWLYSPPKGKICPHKKEMS